MNYDLRLRKTMEGWGLINETTYVYRNKEQDKGPLNQTNQSKNPLLMLLFQIFRSNICTLQPNATSKTTTSCDGH